MSEAFSGWRENNQNGNTFIFVSIADVEADCADLQRSARGKGTEPSKESFPEAKKQTAGRDTYSESDGRRAEELADDDQQYKDHEDIAHVLGLVEHVRGQRLDQGEIGVRDRQRIAHRLLRRFIYR